MRRYVDMYENGCANGDPITGGTMTLSGNDTQNCHGGPYFTGGTSNVRSLGVHGISGSGLVVKVFTTSACNDGSFIKDIAGDGYFTSDQGVRKLWNPGEALRIRFDIGSNKFHQSRQSLRVMMAKLCFPYLYLG